MKPAEQKQEENENIIGVDREKIDFDELVRVVFLYGESKFSVNNGINRLNKSIKSLKLAKKVSKLTCFTSCYRLDEIMQLLDDDMGLVMRVKPHCQENISFLLQKEFEHSKKWHSVHVFDRIFSFKPLFKPELIFNFSNKLNDYKLPERVKLSASIGYDPKQKSSQRYSSLRSFYFQDGRSKSQMMKDRTFKKIDSEVIDTLKSIKENDKDGKVQEIVGEMLRAYELTQCLNLEKALRKYK
jgi:hypothetical protein